MKKLEIRNVLNALKKIRMPKIEDKELFDAIHAFEKAVDELGKETVEAEFIDGEKFIEEYQKQDYDLRVVEALYPMLNSNN